MALFALLMFLSCFITGYRSLVTREVDNKILVEKESFDLIISGLRGQIDKMQRFVVNIENSLSEQKELNRDLKEQVLEFKRDNDVVKAKLRDLQEQANANEERNLYLEKKVKFLMQRLKLVSHSKQAKQPIWQNYDDNKHGGSHANIRAKSKTDIRHEYTPLKDIGNGSAMSHNIHARQITGSVAFSSYVKTDITGLTKGDVIKFDGIMVNDGNAYDFNTGIFTAPRDGLYLFSYFVEDFTDQDLWVFLRQDNYVRSQAVAEPYAEHQNIMGGNVVLIHVTAGSRIWISIDVGTRVQSDLSTFPGMFLH